MTFIIGLLTAMISTWWGIYLLQRSLRLRKSGKITMGTITRLGYQGYRLRSVFIEFKINKGRKVEIDAGAVTFGGYTRQAAMYQVGVQVAVIYNPKNPTEATIYLWEHLWLPPLFFILLGMGFLMAAIFGK